MWCLKASISQVDGSLQEWIVAIQDAPSLGALMWAAWRLARVLAVKLVEEEWMERAQRPTEWPKCKKCGAQLRSKGFVERYLTGRLGPCGGSDAWDAVPIGVRSVKSPLWIRSSVCSPISASVLGCSSSSLPTPIV